jgi:hypothetical protein
MTWADVIKASLRRINVGMAGEEPAPQDQADAFLRLQAWVDSLATEKLTIPYILRTTWTITSTKGTLAVPYTVGLGGDLNVARPGDSKFISAIKYQDTSTTPVFERPLAVYDDDQWAAQAIKGLTGTLPSAAYYNPTYAAGFGSLYLTPIPSQANLQGVFYAKAAVAKPVAVTDVILLPTGYERFIRDNFAIELAPEFRPGLPVDRGLVRAAAASRLNIENANMRPLEMTLDPAVTIGGGGYNIFTDQ